MSYLIDKSLSPAFFLNLRLLFLAVLESGAPLSSYLSSNSLLNPHQSGFTKHHSTETLLVSLYNELVSAVSHQQVSCLCLLDISAAFDTIDHNILLQRLSSWFGVSGTALLWFQ